MPAGTGANLALGPAVEEVPDTDVTITMATADSDNHIRQPSPDSSPKTCGTISASTTLSEREHDEHGRDPTADRIAP